MCTPAPAAASRSMTAPGRSSRRRGARSPPAGLARPEASPRPRPRASPPACDQSFFGLDAISKKRHEHIKVASVGNPGLHLATIAGALPGMPGLMTAYMERKMGKLDIPPIPEFIEMIADTGAGLYGCQASCDLFGLGKDDLIDQVTGIITVGEFYALAAGGQIIFT